MVRIYRATITRSMEWFPVFFVWVPETVQNPRFYVHASCSPYLFLFLYLFLSLSLCLSVSAVLIHCFFCKNLRALMDFLCRNREDFCWVFTRFAFWVLLADAEKPLFTKDYWRKMYSSVFYIYTQTRTIIHIYIYTYLHLCTYVYFYSYLYSYFYFYLGKSTRIPLEVRLFTRMPLEVPNLPNSTPMSKKIHFIK